MKKIIVCIGTDNDKNIRVRLSLCNDGAVFYHSCSFAPGDDPEQWRVACNAHLALPFEQSGIPQSPWPEIPADEWAEAIAVFNVLHTPPRKIARFERDIAAITKQITEIDNNAIDLQQRIADEIAAVKNDPAKIVEISQKETATLEQLGTTKVILLDQKTQLQNKIKGI